MDYLLVPPKDAMLPNFVEKTHANSHKISKCVKLFSLKSFPLYGSYSVVFSQGMCARILSRD